MNTIDLLNKPTCLTAHNMSMNFVMEKNWKEQFLKSTLTNTSLYGSDMINLFAKAGRHVFSKKLGGKTPSFPLVLAAWLNQDTNQITSTVTCLIGFTNYSKASPQRAESFSLLVKGILPEKDHL